MDAAIQELEGFETAARGEITKRVLREAIERLKADRRAEEDPASRATSTASVGGVAKPSSVTPSAVDDDKSDEHKSKTVVLSEGPMKVDLPSSKVASGVERKYEEISQFGWDQDPSYGSGTKRNVYVYVTLPGIGQLPPGSIDVRFAARGFDLVIHDYQGNKNLRLTRSNLEKEIDPSKSRFRVSSSGDRITITMKKKNGDEHWLHLTSKKTPGEDGGAAADDPASSLMDLMKQMYDEGDDTMKKTIGEAMMKSRTERMAAGKGF